LVGLPFQHFPGHPGPLSLAIHPWVIAMSTGDGSATFGEKTASSAKQWPWY